MLRTRGVTWYQKRSPKAALDFIGELNRAANAIREAPECWPKGKNDTRRFLLWRFPFTMIYSEQDSVITIWAVAHGHDAATIFRDFVNISTGVAQAIFLKATKTLEG